MNNFKLILSVIITLTNLGCNAQNKVNEDKQVISMLKQFYEAHAKLWSNARLLSPDVFNKKADSLQQKYCTQQLSVEAKNYLQDGHDLLTDDWSISNESLVNMEIKKDNGNENYYVVSYIIDAYPVAPDKPVKKQVVLHVRVVKDGDSYKIDSVK